MIQSRNLGGSTLISFLRFLVPENIKKGENPPFSCACATACSGGLGICQEALLLRPLLRLFEAPMFFEKILVAGNDLLSMQA